MRPKVSVCIITYNHQPYIAQALDSVLMQETDFGYEIVLGEDESQDGTREICIEYAERFPDRIRLFLRSREDVIYVNGRPTGRFNFVENLKAARGQYIALLEGDDYWTDARKLQKQVDFLETHPECAMCFHRAIAFHQNGSQPSRLKPPVRPEEILSLGDLLAENVIATASVVFRNSLLIEYPEWYFGLPFGDWPLYLFLAQRGSIGYLDEVMAAYRIHSQGSWWSANELSRRRGSLSMYENLYPSLDAAQQRLAKGCIAKECLAIAVIHANHGHLARARTWLKRGLTEAPLALTARWLDVFALLVRIYAPWLYRLSKQFQRRPHKLGQGESDMEVT